MFLHPTPSHFQKGQAKSKASWLSDICNLHLHQDMKNTFGSPKRVQGGQKGLLHERQAVLQVVRLTHSAVLEEHRSR